MAFSIDPLLHPKEMHKVKRRKDALKGFVKIMAKTLRQ
tara:strand:- start:4491 stop:4604 length:114 start_codon:yes stop_codon:yes gene_type:complete